MTLTIKELTKANVTRCEAIGGFNHSLKAWSLMEWAGAATFEYGEGGNYAKKISRIDLGLPGNKATDGERQALIAKMADEIADGIHYGTLWAAAAGIDLEAVLRNKFNEVSDRIGSDIKL